MLPSIGSSSRSCVSSMIRHVRRPVLNTSSKQLSSALDLAQQPSTQSTTTATSFSRHFYRNYRNDYFSNGPILKSILDEGIYLPPVAVGYHRRHCQQQNLYHQNATSSSSSSLFIVDQRRAFGTSSIRRYAEKDESKSKVERTLTLLKEELEARAREDKELQAVKDAASSQKKKSLWRRAVEECKHYYHGFKLLGMDFKVSARLLWHVLRGQSLSRKERRQLIRSVSDLFRLVPFLIFVIVPFMEFTLPIFLKLFPNMLPSTFQEASKETEKVRKQLKVKLEMAKFLQSTMEELSLERQKLKEGGSKVKDFTDFLKKIREEQGGYVSNSEILKFSKLFEDELTLDNLSHAQLRALCRIVGLQPIGTSNMLRFQLYMKLRELKADDKLIASEGVDTMSVLELQQACRARGLRSVGVSEPRLKQQLSQWLELSLSDKVPPSLLLLSSTLYLPEEMAFSDRLATLMKQLPSHLSEEVSVKLAELEGEKVDNKTRLELIKTIEASLKKEHEEEERLLKLEEQKKIAVKLEAASVAEHKKIMEELVDKAPTIRDAAVQAAINKIAQKEIGIKELESVEELLSDAARGKLAEEKEDLLELKRDLKEHKEDVSEVQALMVMKGEKVEESKAAKRLQAQVDRMISRADNLIEKLHEEKQNLKEELTDAPEQKEAAKKDIIFINDMMLSLRRLQKLPDDQKLDRVVEVLKCLDEDHDGAIDVNLALKVIELMGQENVKLSSDQMQQICALLKKESIVDELEQVQLHHPFQPTSASSSQPKPSPSQQESKQHQQQQHQEKNEGGDGASSSPTPASTSDSTATGLESQKRVEQRVRH